jgi:hypothetical protein
MRLAGLAMVGLLACALFLPGCSSTSRGVSCTQYKNDLIVALANPRDKSLPRSLDDIEEPYRGQIVYQRQHFYANWYGPVVVVRGVTQPQVPANPAQKAQIIEQWYKFSNSIQTQAMNAKGC